LQEGTAYGFPAVPLNKDSEELVVHLPTVYGFLVFHAFFGDEDVDDLWVGDGTVTFELLANDVAEVGWREVESVEGAYFWSLDGGFVFLVSRARGVQLLGSRNGTSLGRVIERVDGLRWDSKRSL
jgi:hypothetical protein